MKSHSLSMAPGLHQITIKFPLNALTRYPQNSSFQNEKVKTFVCYSLFSRNLPLSKLKLGFVVFSSPLFCIQNPGLHSVFRKLVRIGSC
ncbi:hypothetical protein ES288_D10G071700v1 [Gossypium darwinii]|uniref:Uncharacterized protein n=1 Tax=Gossypium darwinii TaxID=34276 RepID=A0A5D2AX32_GOSDA|nr:hypothetical protein ES288_D10G071700v1 [Gossypium darwinii]